MTSTLIDHQPGYAALTELHRIQSAAPPLSGAARFFAIQPLLAEAKPWHTGYLGELEVGNRLNALRAEGYTVLHGVQPGSSGADVDHLVITPTGFVYAINTKHHRGKKITVYENSLLINGSKTDHVKKARAEQRKVLRHIDAKQMPISGSQGMIIFVAPGEVKFQKHPADLWLGKDSEVVRHIQAEEKRRSGALPFDASPLTESTFWRANYDHALLAQQDERTAWFSDLQRQLSRRASVQFAWVALALGLGAGLLAIVLSVVSRLG